MGDWWALWLTRSGSDREQITALRILKWRSCELQPMQPPPHKRQYQLGVKQRRPCFPSSQRWLWACRRVYSLKRVKVKHRESSTIRDLDLHHCSFSRQIRGHLRSLDISARWSWPVVRFASQPWPSSKSSASVEELETSLIWNEMWSFRICFFLLFGKTRLLFMLIFENAQQ